MERNRDGCWLCGGQLIWQSDYNPEDMGHDPGTLGIVAILRCSDCGAMVEYTLIEEEEDAENNPMA